MTSFLNVFLKTELTCLPRLLTKYIGNYYDNALCNGATWMFLLWNILHYVFDKFLNAFLRRTGYKKYVRNVLLTALWYLGFYSAALAYTASTLKKNDVELFNFKRMHVPALSTAIPTEIMGYILICTFYLHSAFWELIRRNNPRKMLTYFALTVFFISSFILRIVEVSFTLTALVSMLKIVEEFTRIFFIFSDSRQGLVWKISATNLFLFVIIAILGFNAIIIPATFLAPMMIKVFFDYPNILFSSMTCWLTIYLTAEVYRSIVWKLAMHWVYHIEKDKLNSCKMDIFDCSIFEERDDFSFHLQQFRSEYERRESELMSLRKPKNRNMLLLKCMVSIKKKLNEKRRSRSGNSSDSDSDKSEDDYKYLANEDDDDTEKIENDKLNNSDDCDTEESIGDFLTKGKEVDDLVEDKLPEEELNSKAKIE